MTHPDSRARDQRGSIVLGVLILFVGCLVFVGLPNLLNAIQRGHQKRNMSDLRSIGTAVESYQVDRGFPPRVFGDNLEIEVLVPHLQPTYTKKLPLRDPWGRAFGWHHADGDEYSIVSLGKDGRTDAALTPGATTSFSADLYYSDGQFTIFPQGTMN